MPKFAQAIDNLLERGQGGLTNIKFIEKNKPLS